MSLVKRLLHPERRAYPPDWLARLFGDWYGTKSGVQVSTGDAWKYTAFYACVDLISRGIAHLPLPLYERKDEDVTARATGHPVYELVHTRPNPEQTAFVWRQAMQAWLLTWGNAYAAIERVQPSGRPEALWAMPPDTVRVQRNDAGALEYVQNYGMPKQRTLQAANVLHLRTMGDGILGKSPVRLFAESIGLGLAAERTGATFFGNGMRPSGVLEHPGSLTAEGLENLKKSLADEHGGPDNAGKLLVLEEGMKYNALTIPPEDAQFLETRTFQVRDIARIFHVPPHKLADLADATFANVEEQNIEWVADCLAPWMVNWEQELNWKLLSPREREGYFVEFVAEGLLRGNATARQAFYHGALSDGWMTINEVRRKENLNPIGPAGDINYVPMNMTTAEAALDAQENPAPEPAPPPPVADDDDEEDGEEDGGRDLRAHRDLLVDTCGRIVRAEVESLRKAVKRGKVAAEVADLGQSGHRTRTRTVLTPVIRATAAALGYDPDAASLRAFIGSQVDSHNADVALVAACDDITGAMLQWEHDAPGAWADEILTALGGRYAASNA